jgi:predicted glutamine amidotransferase
MCRLLYQRSAHTFDASIPLEKFALIAKNSKEYQGHGWGCAYLQDNKWQLYKSLKPVWEDKAFPRTQTTLLIAHARSAFRDRDIALENNMPFINGDWVFIFNGELHGVKIKEAGRIGAEKIFNFILRFYQGDMQDAVKKGIPVIERRSRYVKAMNLIIADKQQSYLSTLYNEEDDYFTMYVRQTADSVTLCSDPFPAESGWKPIKNKTMRIF